MFFSPPENDRTYVLAKMFIFFRARDLRDAWADRLEILQDGQY